MIRSIRASLILSIAGLLAFAPIAFAQTPDGETPAEEEACTKYEGEGARHGLCIAYCEAQDCETYKDDESCQRIQENFISYSKKKGYTSGKKPPGKVTIDCRTSACSAEDVQYCRGRELDCFVDKECTEVCSATFEGFSPEGKPLCARTICKKCTKDPDCDLKVCEEPADEAEAG